MDWRGQRLLGAPQGRHVLTAVKKALGVTLIEMMIAIAVFAILILAALPSFTAWIQNTQIRTAAEAILNGLQLARVEAVRRNTSVELQMNAGSGWTVTVVPTGEVVQTRLAEEGSQTAQVTIKPDGANKVTFGGLGQVATNNNASETITEIKIDTDKIPASETRELCVTVSSGGVTRLCDPQAPAGDTRACVPAVPPGCL